MTGKPVILRERAHRDVEDAVAWSLQEADSGTALALIDALESTTTHLARRPATGSPRDAHALNLPGLRFWPLSRFPFLVFYFEHPEHIDVWRVLHGSRDIPAWMQEPA